MAELSGFVASFNACKDPKHVLAIAETLGAEEPPVGLCSDRRVLSL